MLKIKGLGQWKEFNVLVHTYDRSMFIMTLECRNCGMTKVTKDYDHYPLEEEINQEVNIAEVEHKNCKLVVH